MDAPRTEAGKRLLAEPFGDEEEQHVELDDILAIEAEAGGLDAAWAAAEASLPDGWGIVLSVRYGMADAYAVNPVTSGGWAFAGNGWTPAAALEALVSRLSEAA